MWRVLLSIGIVIRTCVAETVVGSLASRNIRLVAGRGLSSSHVGFMYAPLLRTLEMGLGVQHVEWSEDMYAQIHPGDIFVFAGVWGVEHVNWKRLRQRGAYLIYYQSEPCWGQCYFTRASVDEMWDYAWANIDACKRHKDAPILRYVPIGDYTQHSPVGSIGATSPMMFLGGIKTWRKADWTTLKGSLGSHLVHRYDVWNERTFQDVLSKHVFFLNIHKNGARRGPAQPRLSLLVQHGKLVISARCYWKDEQEFKGLVDFVEMNDIAHTFNHMRNDTHDNLLQRAQKRQLEFQRRFNIQRIFERANITFHRQAQHARVV